MKTKFYTIVNNKWTKTKLTADKLSWHWIQLYKKDLSIKGIGMYPTSVDTTQISYEL